MCKNKPDMFELVKTLSDGLDLGPIESETEGCPACILAAIRQSGLHKDGYYDENGDSIPPVFDYSKAKVAWWAEVNEEDRMEDEGYY